MKKTFVTVMIMALLASAGTAAARASGPPTPGMSWTKQFSYEKASPEKFFGELRTHGAGNRAVLPIDVFVSNINNRRVTLRQLEPYEYPSYIFAFRRIEGTVVGYLITPHKKRYLRIVLPPSWLK